MKLDFNLMDEKRIPHFKDGEGEILLKKFENDWNRVLLGRLEPGSSIGFHVHDTSTETIYILEGKGKCLVEGGEEKLLPGDCTYCGKGEGHSLVNDGDEDLVFFAVVSL